MPEWESSTFPNLSVHHDYPCLIAFPLFRLEEVTFEKRTDEVISPEEKGNYLILQKQPHYPLELGKIQSKWYFCTYMVRTWINDSIPFMFVKLES